MNSKKKKLIVAAVLVGVAATLQALGYADVAEVVKFAANIIGAGG